MTIDDMNVNTAEEEKERRATVCATCPSANLEEFKCTKQDCYISMLVSFTFKSCPLDKW